MPPPNVGTVTLAKVGNAIKVVYPAALGATNYNIKHRWFDVAGTPVGSGNFTSAAATTTYSIVMPNNGDELIVEVFAIDSTGTLSTAPSLANWKRPVPILKRIWGWVRPWIVWAVVIGIIGLVVWRFLWPMAEDYYHKYYGGGGTEHVSATAQASDNTQTSTPKVATVSGAAREQQNSGPYGATTPNAKTAGSVNNAGAVSPNVTIEGNIGEGAIVNIGGVVQADTPRKHVYVPSIPGAPPWTKEKPADELSVPPAGWDTSVDLPCELESGNRRLITIDAPWFVEIIVPRGVPHPIVYPMHERGDGLEYSDVPDFKAQSGQTGMSLGTSGLYIQPAKGPCTVYLRFSLQKVEFGTQPATQSNPRAESPRGNAQRH